MHDVLKPACDHLRKQDLQWFLSPDGRQLFVPFSAGGLCIHTLISVNPASNMLFVYASLPVIVAAGARSECLAQLALINNLLQLGSFTLHPNQGNLAFEFGHLCAGCRPCEDYFAELFKYIAKSFEVHARGLIQYALNSESCQMAAQRSDEARIEFN